MKRNFIKLVNNAAEVNEKNAEPKFDTYLTPGFIPLRIMYEASDVADVTSGNTELTEQQQVDMMLDMVVKIYNNQFTRDQLLDGLHSPDALETIEEQVEWVAQGKMHEDRKKQLAKMV